MKTEPIYAWWSYAQTFVVPRIKLTLHGWFYRSADFMSQLWLMTRQDVMSMFINERSLISLESQIGRSLFGPISDGDDREFFNVNDHVWIWYESWVDSVGKRKAITVKFDINDNGVWKFIDGYSPQLLSGKELQNFIKAIQAYFEQVMQEVYHRSPITGQRLTDNKML